MIHITPKNDTKEHLLQGTTCECEPEIITEPNCDIMVVHNSYDGREGIEILDEVLKENLITVDKSKGWDIIIED